MIPDPTSKTLADLKPGQRGVISKLTDKDLSLKLMDMGCIPGCEIELCGKAPFGGPLSFCVCGYNLSVRKEEAATIVLQ